MGMMDKMKGKAEEMGGKMKDDKGMEMKGKARQMAAKAEDKHDAMRHGDSSKRPTL